MQQLPPETQAIAIGFLISVGKWAMSELKERWKLGRKRELPQENQQTDGQRPQDELVIDLSNELDVQTNAPGILADVVSQKSTLEIQRTFTLIEQRQKLIFDWRQTKNFNQDALLRGQITPAAVKLQATDLDDNIRNALAEIEQDLASLGLEVEKEPLN